MTAERAGVGGAAVGAALQSNCSPQCGGRAAPSTGTGVVTRALVGGHRAVLCLQQPQKNGTRQRLFHNGLPTRPHFAPMASPR
jgi:hypothetical protein